MLADLKFSAYQPGTELVETHGGLKLGEFQGIAPLPFSSEFLEPPAVRSLTAP